MVRKRELLDHLWPGQSVADTALNSYIMAVRKAIGDQRASPQLLHTVRGYGYRFVAPVDACDPAPPANPLPSGPPSEEQASVPVHTSPPLTAGIRGYPETLQHCCASVKLPPCGHEIQGDRVERVCSASDGCYSSGSLRYLIRRFAQSPCCFYGTDHARRSFSRSPNVSPAA
jgi:DNA-binding winged helix-turn-helix (wHTH) protein